MAELSADMLDRARGGDDTAFEALVAPLRRELHAHCYRMLGSPYDADDAVQDALVRAWRGLGRFEGRSSLRSWLYAVATRSCLRAIEGRDRRALPVDLGPASETFAEEAPLTEVAWLEPLPGPESAYERRESVELAFVSALQHLPGNQRAVLLMVDVLGYAAAEVAAVMDTSTGAVTSALQRARATVSERVPARSQQTALHALGDAGQQRIVDGFARALEDGDADRLVALLTEDVTWSMPPLRRWYAGRADVMAFARSAPLARCGDWRHRPVEANSQLAVVSWLRPPGGSAYDAWSVNVLDVEGERVRAVTSFLDARHVTRLCLPVSID